MFDCDPHLNKVATWSPDITSSQHPALCPDHSHPHAALAEAQRPHGENEEAGTIGMIGDHLEVIATETARGIIAHGMAPALIATGLPTIVREIGIALLRARRHGINLAAQKSCPFTRRADHPWGRYRPRKTPWRWRRKRSDCSGGREAKYQHGSAEQGSRVYGIQ